MSSVTITGMCFRPLYTPKVSPTNCGRTVERRDQILITSLRPELRAASRGRFLAHRRYALFAFLSAEWPWKVRVGENSPNLWPIMLSVTKTGMNFWPL